MRILLLNWRDIRHPKAGGAEVLTHEIARRLVDRGHQLTWLASAAAGSPRDEVIDGVRVLRRGSETTTRLHAPRAAARGRYDVVVEEINTLPYLAPLWSGSRTVLFIPQLAREVWWYEAPQALAPIGYALEPFYLQTYRDVVTVTISMSTLADLRALGFRNTVHVIPMAASRPAAETLRPKAPIGRLVIIGRLVRSKRVDDAIRALAFARRTLPEATLAVIGDGPERGTLEAVAAEEGVADAVRFLGRVTEDEKERILTESDAVVAAAVREGWGLTITEGARVGTPAVAYDIPGLRDSIVSGRTGIVTEQRPAALGAGIVALLGEPGRFEDVRRAAWERASVLTWERTASAFERALLRPER